jgi:hypothetical protein
MALPSPIRVFFFFFFPHFMIYKIWANFFQHGYFRKFSWIYTFFFKIPIVTLINNLVPHLFPMELILISFPSILCLQGKLCVCVCVCVFFWVLSGWGRGLPSQNLVNNCVKAKFQSTRGVWHYDLAIYMKKYLKAKEELRKLKYFTMQKYT